MTAFRVDDGMYDHPKFEGISDSAIALWTRAGSWCGRYLNGGYVPEDRIRKLGYSIEVAEELVSRGIWKHGPPPDSEVDSTGGFHFHQWHQHQPTKEKVESEREKWREDKRRQRTKHKDNSRLSATDSTTESRNGMELRESVNSDLSSLSEIARGVPENDDSPPPTSAVHQFEVMEGFREALPKAFQVATTAASDRETPSQAPVVEKNRCFPALSWGRR
jgi:hypothetical protein